MKKLAVFIIIFALCISCGDSDSEDFDPTRIDIVTGMNLTDSNGQLVGIWGNPNVAANVTFGLFPKPAFQTIRIVTATSIENIWIVRGLPTRNFTNTNFNEVFSENTYQLEEIEARAFKTFANPGGNNITLNISDISQGYYRVFIQLQDDSILWDNIYIEGTNGVNLDDINFWN